MSFLSEGTAVVTGAGSGIGRALAQQLAATHSGLALPDIDEAGLRQTVRSLEKKGALITTHILDVADEKAMCLFAKDVRTKHGCGTLLIKNAGAVLDAMFAEISVEDCRWLVNCVFW